MTAGRSDRLLAEARRRLEAGPLPEAELARCLYAVRGPVEPWLPLVRRLLDPEEGFERSDDGSWSLRAGDAELAPLALAGRAAGGGYAFLHTLAACAADRPSAVWRWRFDARLERAEGACPESGDEEDAPIAFATVAGELARLASGRTLLTLDGRVPAALAEELERCGYATLRSPSRLLGREVWLDGGRKRSLEAARAAVGLVPQSRDQLTGELELVVRLWQRETAAGTGAGGFVDPPDTAERRETLRATAERSPEAPGVYVFIDPNGEALYVGSASRLRRRVLSYFRGGAEEDRELRGLLASSATLETHPLGTHLDAVLLEAEMIEQLCPPYNTQRRVDTQPAWLRIGAEAPVGVVQVATMPRSDAALHLGPLPSRAAADAAADLLAALWGFRRRGASPRSSPESRARLDELRTILEDPERFCGEARRRLHLRRSEVSLRRWLALSARLERVERASHAGELVPLAAGALDAIVIRDAPEEDALYLSLVRGLRPLASARVPIGDGARLLDAAARLVAIPVPEDEPPASTAALTARWLHAHRDVGWIAPEDSPERFAARLLAALAPQPETRAPEAEP